MSFTPRRGTGASGLGGGSRSRSISPAEAKRLADSIFNKSSRN